MSESHTTQELAREAGIGERQVRNCLLAVREALPGEKLSAGRGVWTARARELLLEVQAAGGPRSWLAANGYEPQPPTAPPAQPPAIVPTVERAAIAPHTGAGLAATTDALAGMRALLDAASSQLRARSSELDEAARARAEAIQELRLTAARLQAERLAIQERELWEAARDREAGKLAANLAEELAG